MSNPTETGAAGTDKEFLEVFATTGHATLNAVLIVAGGAEVTFLAFLGHVLNNEKLASNVGPTSLSRLLWAMTLFVIAIVFALLCHGGTFLSHAAYYRNRTHLGDKWMKVVGALWLASMLFVIAGALMAVWGLNSTNALLGAGPPAQGSSATQASPNPGATTRP